MKKRYYTSEGVTEGHPDKIADQISDAILDDIIAKDSSARVAVETTIASGLVLVSGNIDTNCYVDIPKVVRDTIRKAGYKRSKFGFDCDTCAVLTAVNDFKNGYHSTAQGIVFGYATNETQEFMPMSYVLAHRMAKRLAEVRKNRLIPYLRPDGKTQITVEYHNNQPIGVKAIVISAQHKPDIANETLIRDIKNKVINDVIPSELLQKDALIMINPTGRFVIGGPKGDAGLTGRKIIADYYGGISRHGGLSPYGRDPHHLGRFGSYLARWVAKNIVYAKLADKCEVQLSYVAGKSTPIALDIETFGTNKIGNPNIIRAVEKTFDLRPEAVVEELQLYHLKYQPLAVYGQFGRNDVQLPWESKVKSEILVQNV